MACKDPAARRKYQNEWLKAKRKGPRGGEVRDTHRRYRAKSYGVEVAKLPAGWERQQLEYQDFTCYWCEADIGLEIDTTDFHADHIQPLDEGGEHSPDNLVLACRKCNCSDGARITNGRPAFEPASEEDEVL